MGKTIIRILLLHIGFFVIATVVFILSFHSPLFSHVVFFYRGIALLTLVCISLTVFLVCLKRRLRIWTVRDIILSVVWVWSINLIFFTHVPVTADRSLSVFLLGYMNARTQPVSKEMIRQAFIDTYITENGAVEKRLTEQFASGTITKERDAYTIAPRGRWIIRMYAWVSDLFGIEKKNLYRTDVQKP